MKLKVFSIIFLFTSLAQAQFTVSGTVTSVEDGTPIANAEVWNKTVSEMVLTNEDGVFSIENLQQGNYEFAVFSFEYAIADKEIFINEDTRVNFELAKLSNNLSEVMITNRREEIFALRKLRKVEGTAIYAGKKSEVVLLDKTVGNLAANNARQIYNQVVGLNIYDNGDAGLQLNIGGRGLDPNRTQNFNTRQNGYDISADVLGYPES